MDRKTETVHYHIFWSRVGPLNWEPFNTRVEAEASAGLFVLPGETYAIEEQGRLPVPWIMIDFEISRGHVRKIDADRVYAIILRINQEVVAVAGEGYRQPSRKPSDAR